MNALTTYLNDHLAGSVAALELIDHLREGANFPDPAFLVWLQTGIEADQRVLNTLAQRVGGESIARKAAGWIAEKLLRFKIRTAGGRFDHIGLLEALEVLALGITGKQLLWGALRHVLADSALVRDLDWEELQARAAEQFQRLESYRLASARAAFGSEAR